MAFDGIVTKAITNEISFLNNCRIDKVFQPNKNCVVLGLYIDGKNYALNICIESQNCRINLTTHPKQNPQVAPNFCMLLRKNIIGLKLKNIYSLDLERIVFLELEGFDELDDVVTRKLVVELMGKHSNVILLDENNVIIDSLRHIKEDSESYRNILPHTKYELPMCDKANFLEINNYEEFYGNITSRYPDFIMNSDLVTLPKLISTVYNGISRSFVSSIITELDMTNVNEMSLKIIYNYISKIIDYINSNKLSFKKVCNNEGIARDYFLCLSENNSGKFQLNFFLDDFYYEKETSETFKNYRNSLLKLILETLKKYNKRLYHINEKLKECDDMDKYKVYGELITANLYRIPNKNMDEVILENYYDNYNEIVIKLDKKYTPNENAKRFFKKYSKLKNALEVVSVQKKETLKELDYIESVVYELENSSNIEDVMEIFEEITESEIFQEFSNRYNKNNKPKIKKSKFTKNKNVSFNPVKYIVDGHTVLVGRNNKENDYLTLKFSNKNDIWFHTKTIHGSHTILRVDSDKVLLNEELLIKVAKIAARHSKGNKSSNVPVDYCEVKFVKKPSGSKPGMVIYSNYKTVFVNP